MRIIPSREHVFESTGSLRLRPPCLPLGSLNRPLVEDKVRDYSRHRRVEANYVEHSAVVRVGEDEVDVGHAHGDGTFGMSESGFGGVYYLDERR